MRRRWPAWMTIVGGALLGGSVSFVATDLRHGPYWLCVPIGLVAGAVVSAIDAQWGVRK